MKIEIDFNKECEVFMVATNNCGQYTNSHYTRPNYRPDQILKDEAFIIYNDLKHKMNLTDLIAIYIARNQVQLDHIIEVSEGKRPLGE